MGRKYDAADRSQLRVLAAALLLLLAIGIGLQMWRATRLPQPRRGSGEVDALYIAAHETTPRPVTLLCSESVENLRRDPACANADVQLSADFVYYTLFGIEVHRTAVRCGGLR